MLTSVNDLHVEELPHMTFSNYHIPEGQVNRVTTHPSVPTPPNGMLIRCLLSWTFDRLTVPPTFVPDLGSSRAEQPERLHQGW